MRTVLNRSRTLGALAGVLIAGMARAASTGWSIELPEAAGTTALATPAVVVRIERSGVVHVDGNPSPFVADATLAIVPRSKGSFPLRRISSG